VLTPLGGAAIVGLLLLAALIAASRGAEGPRREGGEPDAWRVPPASTLLAAVLLIACAEVGAPAWSSSSSS